MKILVIAPHADDEVLGVGGTIAKHKSNGDNVTVCIVTIGYPPMFTKKSIERLKEEVYSSHKILGVENTVFLNLPAVKLSELPKHIMNNAIDKIFKTELPDIVYIPHFGDMHYDHFLVSQASMVAARPINKQRIIELYSYETLSETEWNVTHTANVFIPNTYIDITQFIDIKINAMKKYSSQLKKPPHPRSLESIIAQSKLRGSTAGLEYAEAFSLIRKIVI